MQFIDLKAQQARIGSAIQERINRVLEHGRYIMGPEVLELEARLGHYLGVEHAVSCSNGTDALILALRIAGVGPGDAVFVPSFTFFATAEAVSSVGAVPVFVDVEVGSFNMDPEHLKHQLEGLQGAGGISPGTPKWLTAKAVIAVDLFGLPADYARLIPFCRDVGLVLIADGAQSFGASIEGKKAASLPDISTTSFFPAKPLGAYGDGGAVFCRKERDADFCRSLRVHGKGKDKYDNVELGYNARLDTMQAAVLLEKLSIFDDELALRQRVAATYDRTLGDLAPSVPEGFMSAWAQYTLRVANRDVVGETLAKREIPAMVYYPKGIHQQGAYSWLQYQEGALPTTETLCRQVISLPMHPYLSVDEQARVTEAVMCVAEPIA